MAKTGRSTSWSVRRAPGLPPPGWLGARVPARGTEGIAPRCWGIVHAGPSQGALLGPGPRWRARSALSRRGCTGRRVGGNSRPRVSPSSPAASSSSSPSRPSSCGRTQPPRPRTSWGRWNWGLPAPGCPAPAGAPPSGDAETTGDREPRRPHPTPFGRLEGLLSQLRTTWSRPGADKMAPRSRRGERQEAPCCLRTGSVNKGAIGGTAQAHSPSTP